MILLNFREGHALRLGLKTDAGVIDIAAAQDDRDAGFDGGAPTTIDGVLSGGESATRALLKLAEKSSSVPTGAAWLRQEAGLEIAPAVPKPGKIVCVGLNYRRHAEESGAAIPETPVLFSKFGNTIAAPNEEIPLPSAGKEYDYEAELAVVVGRTAKNVDQERALDHVYGYAAANDLSARDLQTRTPQWLLGKTLDKFLPLGPYLVSADDVGDPQSLRVRCWLNGDLRQDSSTADMIFSVAEIIAYTSRHFTLDPGDVIITGTPEGVILGMPEKVWLKPGDEVVVEVEKLGRLQNRMVAG